MLNFYPGPSKLDANISKYFQEAVAAGILERNHRSEAFEQLYADVVHQFQQKLQLPKSYQLLFISSATEVWEIIAQSFTKKGSLHFYNGAFGEKWFQYTQKLTANSKGLSFELNTLADFPQDVSNFDVLAFTHNETSNGTQLTNDFIAKVRSDYAKKLIAFDATSSTAGVALDWQKGDIWFASVQKCFGLPSGLGVLILSPKAIEQAENIGESNHYNSALFMLENAAKGQTHYTPNIANIYFLKRVLEDRESIEEVSAKISRRSSKLYNAIGALNNFELLIKNAEVRSDTVLCVKMQDERIDQLKSAAQKENIILGNGYGSLKSSTFRIANFPAIADDEFDQLLNFLRKFDTQIN
ncbi:alanine--glyoxylate aminotransferase family protein [Marivirga atlantica]|jgi:phosphoserine aminotransferase|uniref:phosphoserine transaminase n=1 Tax=Marivirga atlantica TaxID=1548457 RepID=A0A937AA76_9BACT|nr:aminotransferase class V-fold PLP-dependent enzyme [Marivirga atlantica]MBL0766480.1 alanine--glyoxylate aminotransferase family protein [Marivirga atlantica]